MFEKLFYQTDVKDQSMFKNSLKEFTQDFDEENVA